LTGGFTHSVCTGRCRIKHWPLRETDLEFY
jgi:hypothetical protein